MTNPAHEQKRALAAFNAARELYQRQQFAEAQDQVGEYQQLIDYRLFPMTDQRREQMPRCSVIIVIYNTSSDVLACIDRLVSQAVDAEAEIIVVDNGGNEALHKKLLARPILHICCPYNFLPSEGRNIGAFFARAPRILFVDDDGLPAEDYITQANEALERPNTIGVRGRIVPLNHGGGAGRHYDLGDEVQENASFNLEGNMAIKRSVFKAAGGFDPLMFGHEGHELAERCQRTLPNGEIRYWPELVLKHDFAEGEQLAKKRQRQALGEAYRAWLSKAPAIGIASHPPALQKGVTLILRIESTTDLFALQAYLENLTTQNGQLRKEVLLLAEKAPAVSREQMVGIVRKFVGRLACVVLPSGYWQTSVLARCARYPFLLLADALPVAGVAELINGATLMEEGVAPWLQISGAGKSAVFLVSRAAYLAACGNSDKTNDSPKSTKEFVEKAGLPRSQVHEQLEARMHALQTQKYTEDRLQLPSKFSSEVKEFSNRIIHTTPYFRDENLQPWRHAPKVNVHIAFIGSEALYKALESACYVTQLTALPEGGELQNSDILSDCDLLLVESQLLSAGQQAYTSACFAWAKKFRQSGKPSAFWYTESLAHLPLLENLTLHFDYVYATQPETTRCLERYLQEHKLASTSVQPMEPCIAPELNNAIRQFKKPTFNNLHVLYDGWADLIEFDDNRNLLRTIEREDLLIADSCWQFNQRKLKDFPEFKPQILGYLTQQQRRQALKEFNTVLITSRTLKSGERLQQEVAEALAAKCLVLLFIHPGDDLQVGAFGDLVEYHTSAKKLSERLQWLKDNPWHCKGLVQQGWRYIHQNHSVQHRIDQLLERAGIAKRVTEAPLVSCLTVTKRPQYIERIVENYQRQQYPNKELLIAINSARVDIQAIEAHLHKSVPGARIYQFNADRNIGFCLNWLMQQATGDYWAKMDDDDEYGSHYVQDYVLNVQALNIDVMGKKMGPTYFEALGQTLYRDPASMSASDFLLHEDSRHHMAGATFFGKSDLLKRNPFSETLRSSVDVEFFRSALKKSLNVMLADDFNFTVFRAADKSHHTWKEDDGALLKAALPVSREEINV